MRACGRNFQALLSGDLCQLAAKLDNLLSRRRRVAADFCAQLDDRLMHLGLHVLFQAHVAVGENLLNVRTQLPRVGINDLEFFLNPESEDVIALVHSPEASFPLRTILRIAWSLLCKN